MNTFSLHPHHIQLSFSEKNELIVYSAILMDKLIIPINNLHYFYVFQSNSESVGVGVATNHFNFHYAFTVKKLIWINNITGCGVGEAKTCSLFTFLIAFYYLKYNRN